MVLANLVPTVPFVILVMIPFIEQIDPQHRGGGAGVRRRTLQALHPRAAAAAAAGILAALLLVLVRTIAMFELTFLVAGPDQPDAGRGALLRGLRRRRARRAVDRRDGGDLYGDHSVWLLIALRFVNPAQIVTRAKQQPAH